MCENEKNQPSDLKSLKDKSDYAWRYFELHAEQRISLVRLYFLIMSFYVTGAAYLLSHFSEPPSIDEAGVLFLTIVFFLISFVFFFLDQRNRELIKIAECSLKELEKEMNVSNDHAIFSKEASGQSSFFRHTQCFMMLFFISILSCVAVIGYSSYHAGLEKNLNVVNSASKHCCISINK